MPTETFTFADEPLPKSEPKQPPSDAQRLLDWLQEWKKPVVSTRDIRIYGPRPLRDQKIATNSVEVLIRHGFLAEPTEKRQRNWHQWRVIQKRTHRSPHCSHVAGNINFPAGTYFLRAKIFGNPPANIFEAPRNIFLAPAGIFGNTHLEYFWRAAKAVGSR